MSGLITLHGPSDVVSSIPALLGCHPRIRVLEASPSGPVWREHAALRSQEGRRCCHGCCQLRQRRGDREAQPQISSPAEWGRRVGLSAEWGCQPKPRCQASTEAIRGVQWGGWGSNPRPDGL